LLLRQRLMVILGNDLPLKNIYDLILLDVILPHVRGNGKDELARLAMTFNGMLRRIAEAFTIQKNFIANPLHELRTPLTAISGQLEVILLKERSQEDCQYTLKSVLEDIKNLNSLYNKLLLLAQASSDVVDLLFFSNSD